MTTAAIMWFPEIHQIKIQRNSSWLQSALIGVTAPIMNVWQVVWYLWALPFCKCLAYTLKYARPGNLTAILIKAWVEPFAEAIRLTLGVALVIPLRGLMGDVTAKNVTIDERYRQIKRK